MRGEVQQKPRMWSLDSQQEQRMVRSQEERSGEEASKEELCVRDKRLLIINRTVDK